MDRLRKMVVVPETMLDRLQRHQQHLSEPQTSDTPKPSDEMVTESVQTPGDPLSRLDSEMFDILHTKKFGTVDEKCKRYLQVLRRFLVLRDGLNEKSETAESIESDSELLPLSEQEILSNIPRLYKTRAKRLLQHWKIAAPNRLKWDDTGTVTIDGHTIQASNIVELLNDVVRKRPVKRGRKTEGDADSNALPVGQLEFAKFIRITGTPNELIGNANIVRIGERLTDPINTAKRRVARSVPDPWAEAAASLNASLAQDASPTAKGKIRKWQRLNL